jgi:hypothetical protein
MVVAVAAAVAPDLARVPALQAEPADSQEVAQGPPVEARAMEEAFPEVVAAVRLFLPTADE